MNWPCHIVSVYRFSYIMIISNIHKKGDSLYKMYRIEQWPHDHINMHMLSKTYPQISNISRTLVGNKTIPFST